MTRTIATLVTARPVHSTPVGLVSFALVFLCAAPGAIAQVSERSCGPIPVAGQVFGPYDYRRSDATRRATVENHHFSRNVEMLVIKEPGPDLHFVLRAFPNHHRALLAATRLAVRDKTDQPSGLEWPVECYFERATRFIRDDSVLHSLYAQWLGQRKRKADAEQQLGLAIQLAGDNPLSHYNIGLILVEIGSFEQAGVQARRAKALGWPRADLIDRLRAAGHWRETAEATVGPAQSSSPETLPQRGAP